MRMTQSAKALVAALALGAAGAASSLVPPASAQQAGSSQQMELERLLNESDQAMQRGDTQAARQALQQARRTMDPSAAPELAGNPMDFLRLAQRAIDQGALRTAWIALGRAETRLLPRAVSGAQGEQAAQGGAVGAIRSARQALTERDIELARERTERAMVLARIDNAVGANVPGSALSGAGLPGPAQPLAGGGQNAGGPQQ